MAFLRVGGGGGGGSAGGCWCFSLDGDSFLLWCLFWVGAGVLVAAADLRAAGAVVGVSVFAVALRCFRRCGSSVALVVVNLSCSTHCSDLFRFLLITTYTFDYSASGLAIEKKSYVIV